MKTSLGLDENVEGALCYLLGWLTGIVFLFLERDSYFVRFHAMQSTITFLGLTVLMIILTPIAVLLFVVGIIVLQLIRLAMIVLWLILMLKAYQGEMFKLPVVGDLAESWVKKI